MKEHSLRFVTCVLPWFLVMFSGLYMIGLEKTMQEMKRKHTEQERVLDLYAYMISHACNVP